MTVSPRWQPKGATVGLAVIILLISGAVRLHQATMPEIWYNEAFSILLSRLSVEEILFHAARDVHPPLYYLILHYWMNGFGSDPLAARSLSIVAGIATVGVAMLLTRQLASRRAAVLAGLLLAFFPIAIRYSQEVRMYALLGLLLITAIYMLWLWVNRQRTFYLVAYGVLMVAALYTHYFALLCALANWIYLSLTRDARGKVQALSRTWWVANAAIAIAYLPWLPTLFSQLEHRELVGWIVRYPTSVMSLPRTFWKAFTMNTSTAHTDVYAVLLSVLLLLAALHVLRRDSKPGKPSVLLLCYCFVPVCVVWLVSIFMPLYINRYLFFALLALPLVVAIAADTLPTRALWLAIVGCLLMELTGLTFFFSYQGKPGGELATVMAQVNEQWRTGDALLADRKRSYFSIEYYNATGRPAFLYTQIEPDATGKAATTYGTLTLLYQRSDELYVANPQALTRRFKRLWLVTNPTARNTPYVPLDGWVKIEEIVEGSTKALLFAVPVGVDRQPCQVACDSKLRLMVEPVKGAGNQQRSERNDA